MPYGAVTLTWTNYAEVPMAVFFSSVHEGELAATVGSKIYFRHASRVLVNDAAYHPTDGSFDLPSVHMVHHTGTTAAQFSWRTVDHQSVPSVLPGQTVKYETKAQFEVTQGPAGSYLSPALMRSWVFSGGTE
jgi:hypothetical protein